MSTLEPTKTRRMDPLATAQAEFLTLLRRDPFRAAIKPSDVPLLDNMIRFALGSPTGVVNGAGYYWLTFLAYLGRSISQYRFAPVAFQDRWVPCDSAHRDCGCVHRVQAVWLDPKRDHCYVTASRLLGAHPCVHCPRFSVYRRDGALMRPIGDAHWTELVGGPGATTASAAADGAGVKEVVIDLLQPRAGRDRPSSPTSVRPAGRYQTHLDGMLYGTEQQSVEPGVMHRFKAALLAASSGAPVQQTPLAQMESITGLRRDFVAVPSSAGGGRAGAAVALARARLTAKKHNFQEADRRRRLGWFREDLTHAKDGSGSRVRLTVRRGTDAEAPTRYRFWFEDTDYAPPPVGGQVVPVPPLPVVVGAGEWVAPRQGVTKLLKAQGDSLLTGLWLMNEARLVIVDEGKEYDTMWLDIRRQAEEAAWFGAFVPVVVTSTLRATKRAADNKAVEVATGASATSDSPIAVGPNGVAYAQPTATASEVYSWVQTVHQVEVIWYRYIVQLLQAVRDQFPVIGASRTPPVPQVAKDEAPTGPWPCHVIRLPLPLVSGESAPPLTDARLDMREDRAWHVAVYGDITHQSQMHSAEWHDDDDAGTGRWGDQEEAADAKVEEVENGLQSNVFTIRIRCAAVAALAKKEPVDVATFADLLGHLKTELPFHLAAPVVHQLLAVHGRMGETRAT